MWDFIKYIFRILFEGALGYLGSVLARRFYVKMFIDKKSNLHYDKLIQKVQTWYFQLRITLIFALLNMCRVLGMIKGGTKEQQKDLILILVLIFAIIMSISKMKFTEDKKTELA